MLRTILCLIVFCFGSALVSQTKTDGAALLAKEIKLSDTAIKDFAPNLNSLDQQPIPASEYGNKKEELYKQRIKIDLSFSQAAIAVENASSKVSPVKIISTYFFPNCCTCLIFCFGVVFGI